MADHFEIQSNRLVAEQIEIRIRRTVEGAILGPNAVYPKVVHLLPSLILALKNLEERKIDFQKNSQSVWTQLLRLFQNIQELDTESELIDLSAATKLAEITTELSKSQLELTQPELREASGPVRGIKLLTEVLLNCGRKTLTFLLGEILCLHELLPFVPKREEHFLNYFPSQEIQRVDEDGDYHTVVQEIGEASYFVLESFINSHSNFLRNIQALYTFLNLVYKLGQVQSLNPGPLETLRPELISLSNKLNQLPQVKRFSRKISIRELELLIKKTKKNLKKLILLAVSASEEQVQKVNRQSLQVNQS
ncbi:hypothetical protein DAPPUDRAFT_122811, partial [Daphnia pulex]